MCQMNMLDNSKDGNKKKKKQQHSILRKKLEIFSISLMREVKNLGDVCSQHLKLNRCLHQETTT